MRRIAALFFLAAISTYAQFTVPQANAALASNGPTFTLVQHTLSTSAATTASITTTIPSTAAGDALVVLGVAYGIGPSGALSSVTDSASQTWTHCPSSSATTLNTGSAYFQSVDCFYFLSTAAGVTTVTTTWNGAPSVSQKFQINQLHRTSGSWAYDSSSNTTNGALACTSCSGAALTGLAGNPGYLLQVAASKESGAQTWAISGGSWAIIDSGANNSGMFAAWNGNTSASPTNSTITLGTSDTLPVGSVAFK